MKMPPDADLDPTELLGPALSEAEEKRKREALKRGHDMLEEHHQKNLPPSGIRAAQILGRIGLNR